jgi:glycosyltransferase involved in cell wall biosynthesis
MPPKAELFAWPAAPAAPAVAEPTLSCVIPCRNEARNLDALLPRLVQALDQCVRRWEIVVINDGSTDTTMEVLARWSQTTHVRTIELSRNFGKEAALTAGLQAAQGELVVMMDADLQHEPELIPALFQKWRDGADMVYAVRANRDDEGLIKRLGTRMFYALVNGKDRVQVPADAGDFRLMHRKVVEALLALPERNRFMKGLYAWVGFNATAVAYTPAPRANGQSHFNAWRLVRLSLDGLTAFTTWPLRAVSIVGFFLASLAFLYGGFLTMAYLLNGHNVSGWTTIVVSLMLFSGIQMMSLGIVGEYVGRIFEEVKGRPLFVVKRTLGQGLEDPRP